MPEFRLDFPKQPPLPPLKRSFITKNEYTSGIKVADWDRERESEPRDFNAYDPPGGNQHRSSYMRLGVCKEDTWKSETHHMLAQINDKKHDMGLSVVPMVSYGNYKETSVPEEDLWKMTPDQCYTDYQSTMHASYKMPAPYVMKPLGIPAVPFLQNRRLLLEQPLIETNKYIDDCIMERIALLQKHKASRFKSYNPCTFKYSDGSEIKDKIRKCQELPYSHVD